MNAAALDALDGLDAQFRSAGVELTPTEHAIEAEAVAGAVEGKTPPSSYCGSECLYTALPINKFFTDRKKEYWCSSIDEDEKKGSGKADNANGRLATGKGKDPPVKDINVRMLLPTPTDKGAKTTTASLKTMEATTNEGRQTKFSFFECTSPTEGTATTKAPSIPTLADALEEDEGRRTKFSFYGRAGGGSSAFDALDSKTGNGASDKDAKHVRFVPLIDSLFDDTHVVTEACSFAESLSTASSREGRREAAAVSAKRYTRLQPEERKKILSDCRAYRLQIATFEDLFLKQHGRMPTGSDERFQLASVYRGYREGKRAIRADAAARIQAPWRGAAVRSKHAIFWAKKFRAEAARKDEEAKRLAEVAAAARARAAKVEDVEKDMEKAKPKEEEKVYVQGIEKPPGTLKEMAQRNIKELQLLKSTLLTTSEPVNIGSNTGEAVNKVTHSFYTPPVIEDKDWAGQALGIEAVFAPGTPSDAKKEPLVPPPMDKEAVHKVTHSFYMGYGREMIAEYLEADERRELATKALTVKLMDKDCRLPDDTNAPEAICDVCDMPKLASTQTGCILKDCAVCDALRAVVEKRAEDRREAEAQRQKKEERKRQKLAALEKKRQAVEKALAKKKEQEEEQRQRLEERQRREMMKLLGERHRTMGMDWSSSVPSMLHLPVEVGAADTSGSSSHEEEPEGRGFDEDAEQAILRKLKKEIEEAEADEDLSVGSGGADEDIKVLRQLKKEIEKVEASEDSSSDDSSPKKDVVEEEEEKDEFDCLLDDADVQKMQRQLHGCPSLTEAQKVAAAESAKKDKLEPPEQKKNDAADKKSKKIEADTEEYGGFASKADYDHFQQMYGNFEKDHADVVDFVRDRVGGKIKRKSKAERKALSPKVPVRSSSAPSLSSLDDSGDFGGRHRHREDYREEKYGRRHSRRRASPSPHRHGRRKGHRERERRHDHYSTDSASELSASREDDRYYGRSRRHDRRHSRDRSYSPVRRDRHHSYSRERPRSRHGRRSHSRERHSSRRGYSGERPRSRRSHSRERHPSRHGYSRERHSSRGGYSRERHSSRGGYSRERYASRDGKHRDRSYSGGRHASRVKRGERRDHRHRSVSSGRRYRHDDAGAGYCSTIFSTDYSSDCSPRRPIDPRGDRMASF